ncbi:hypothetical protein [Pseudooceanicola sp. 200-1SW]|uniref:hypothetical protein n=1 Tax=Pseudooceanicola sp. 200-1SW TaxID=3425949 RepID=UPI003D7FF9A9
MFSFDDTDYKSIRKTAISLSLLSMAIWRYGGAHIKLPESVFEGALPIPTASIALGLEISLTYLLARIVFGFLIAYFSNGGLLKDRTQEAEIAKSLLDFPNSIAEKVEETVEDFRRNSASLSVALEGAHEASKDAIEDCRKLSKEVLGDFSDTELKDNGDSVTVRSGADVRRNYDADLELDNLYRSLANIKEAASEKIRDMNATTEKFVDEINNLKKDHAASLQKASAARSKVQRYPFAIKLEMFDGRIFSLGFVCILSILAIFACSSMVREAGGFWCVVENILRLDMAFPS